MKHKCLSLTSFLITSLFLIGCNEKPISSSSNPETSSISEIISEESSSEESSVIIEKSLSLIQFPNTDYYQYESFDFSNLIVNENTYANGNLTSSVAITDYTLTLEDGTEIHDGDRIKEAAPEGKTIYINKEGCVGTNFVYYASESSNFTQTLIINSKPTKLAYLINETFNADGLSVMMRTRYKADKTKRFDEYLTNDQFTMTINGKSADGFVFTKCDFFTVTISAQGWYDTLTTSFDLSVLKSTEIIDLNTYADNTITWTEDTTKMTVSLSNSTKSFVDGDKGYYSPDEIGKEFTISDIADRNAYNWHYMPSLGNVPILVVPVVTPGDSALATESNWDMIEKAFFGKSNELYFESLHSYYYESSFGQLDLKGGVTGYFDPTSVAAGYSSSSNYTDTKIAALPQLAADWAVNSYGIDLTKYDTNNDGCIDAIWLIYLHDISQNSNFWAFTSTTGNTGTVTNPVANNFAWAGLNFLNDKFAEDYYTPSSYYSNHNCDAHVLIHETGHMLGLNDYYSYGTSGTYNAVGCIDMMSHNLGDQSPYSKLLLGWIKPYIFYGNSATITLSSCQSQNAVIVLPYDDKTYSDTNGDGLIEFNPFDEYLVLDYYTPKNLNASDYDCYSVYHISSKGGRLYHADARLAQYNYYGTTLFDNPDTPLTDTSYGSLIRAITNSEDGTAAEFAYGLPSSDNKFDELRWISANKQFLSYSNMASSSSLFNTNSYKTFSIANYASQFNKTIQSDSTYYFNCQKSFNSSFTIDSIA